MFVQVHMLQSLPPGNVNRDGSGQPKKCIFGGVTRSRISSQSLKSNIRHSQQFKDAFRDKLADRTQYLPRLVAGELKRGNYGIPDGELELLMAAIAAKFKKEERSGASSEGGHEAEGEGSSEGSSKTDSGTGQTPQLVFFPQPFAVRIAELAAGLRKNNLDVYDRFIGKTKKKALDERVKSFVEDITKASKTLTVDIGLFGRMTTSDLVVNVEAACQVAHAISTHEAVTEEDYFTAIDDLKRQFASTQTGQAGAAFLGSGETGSFFNSAVYYKYFNLDVDALRKHLPSLSINDTARVASVFVSAAALSHPAALSYLTGRQSGFANPSVPELILVEVWRAKQPISYANAFLQPVEGGTGHNLMTESAAALQSYMDDVAAAYAPEDVRRALLAIGPASSIDLKSAHERVKTIGELAEKTANLVNTPAGTG